MNARSTQQSKLGKITFIAAIVSCTAFAVRPVFAVQLNAKTARAFDEYIHASEVRDEKSLKVGKDFLYIDGLPKSQKDEAYSDLQRGQIIVQQNNQCPLVSCSSVPGGLTHDWIGLVFVPGATLPQTISLLQDYDRDSEYYPAHVLQSKLLASSGDEFFVYLRLRQTEAVTVVFDTQYDIRYALLDPKHAYSRSYSTRIAEVENAGTAQEHEDSPGNDHGFLWRLDSYWRFYQADGGVYIQCKAISLTRDVPFGLGWLVSSFIEKIPAQSLHATLFETRAALLHKTAREKEKAR